MQSYGLLVYKYFNSELKYLLVHPSGHYNRSSPFYIPKGKKEKGEEDLDAAIRETIEETGILTEVKNKLGTVRYKSKNKVIHIWLAEYESGKVLEDGTCPNHDWENDIVKFFSYNKAKEILREEFLEILEKAHLLLTKSIKK